MPVKKESYISKSRAETFSDGIFAIIVTLLVLEIKVPVIQDRHSAQALWGAMAALFPKILSWMASFLMVCVIWVNHHRIFEQVRVISYAFFWLNAHLLLWCSFIPFPTALIGDYANNTTALLIFGFIMAMMSLAFYFMRLHLMRNSHVFHEHIDIRQYRTATRNSLIFGPGLYLLGGISSLIHPYIAFAIFIIIPFYFIFFRSSAVKE